MINIIKILFKTVLFLQNMMKSVNCFEPEDRQSYFVLCMCRLKPYDPKTVNSNENLQKEKLNLQGTLMIQLMLEVGLNYHKISVVNFIKSNTLELIM